jgi:hypothetical protein
MGIADFFRPKYRHSDVRVRTEAVKALTTDDAAILIQVARSDRDIGVRRIAIGKIEEAPVLAELAAAETERSLRDLAGERAAQLWQSTACDDDSEAAGAALAGIIKLGDQHVLVDVVVMAELPAIRKRAFGELRDPRALAALAKSDAAQDLRTAAVARIDDGDVLRALAIDTTQKEVGLAAVEKIDDVDRLENVAQKAKNKAVRQKARKIVTEIEEAERAKKPGVPDEVKRKRAERAQLLREVEAVVETFDFGKASEIVRKAQAAWTELGEDEGEDRFTRLVERFWRRKEIHEQTARGADELRAVEREAAASKAAAAAERAKQQQALDPANKPEPEVPADPLAEAETAARREERERQRVEEETRRKTLAAERDARAKEDAERAASIASSLRAMCDDMEQLAVASARDTRAIDRLLAQSAKGFESIGKAPPGDRDEIAERYRAARGKLVTKAGELREAEDWERWANVPKAEALIATAKQMAEAPATPDLGNRLRQLQALWKEVGPMPQRRSKELWDTFKVECDKVYEVVRGVRAVETEKFTEVTKVKEALIAEAEAIAESTDWAATAEKLKGLQAQWKQSGHLPRKQGDELWKRFRTACDKFFERRKPLLDAQHDEEAANLQRKQSLIARAQAVADGAPGEGGWGKAIGTIKDLQREWKDIGFVPRRDADTVWRAFRAACDSLFTKRDAARDGEANAHRAELDGLKAEIDAVIAGGDDVVGRAIAVRAKAQEQNALSAEVDAMVRHVLATHADAVKGTELDPSQLRAKREKLIVRAEELLPKQAPGVSAEGNPADIASQLKAAMRQNAFGDLRFSGRDPIEVLDELRTTWNEIGPILADEDHAQAERFEAVIGRVLEANGEQAREPARIEEGGRRRRRDRHSGQLPIAADAPNVSERPTMQAIQPIVTTPPAMPPHAPLPITTMPPVPLPEPSPLEVIPDAAASATSEIAAVPDIVVASHDAITQPARLPPELPANQPREPLPPPPIIAAEPERRKSVTSIPPLDELDSAWDLGDEDPSGPAATPTESPPSSLEMAGDGSAEGDGLDSVD